VATGLLTTLAILVKAPAILIGIPLLAMARESAGGRNRRDLWLCSLLTVALPAVWYAHAYLISTRYYPYHFFGAAGVGLVDLHRYLDIAKRTAVSGLTLPLTVLLVAGVPWAWRGRARVFVWWLLALLAFTVVTGAGSEHPWYQLPLVAVAAALGGVAADGAWTRLVRRIRLHAASIAFGGGAVAVAVMAGLAVKPWYDPWAAPLRAVGRKLDHISPASALGDRR
jgi:hypothetical protein